MKKLLVSGFVLTTLLGTTPQISTLTTTNTNSKIHSENKIQKWTPTPEDFEYIEKYFKSKTIQEIQELKENLLSAIDLKNDVVTFDKSKLNQKIWDLKIYQIITSDKYLKTLNWYYQNKLLTFDVQGKAHFNTPLLINLKIEGVWIESYVYWFGYWRLHFTSSAIESLSEGGSVINELAAQIGSIFPPAAVVAVTISLAALASVATLRSFDHGKGAWMGVYILVPGTGFGSN